MSPSTLACRLCLCLGSELKALVNKNGQRNNIYEVAAKYFDPALLTTVMCVDCWQHIDEFYQFQQSVLNAQERICEADIGPLVKLETVLMSQNDEVEKMIPLVKFEPLTILQEDDDKVRENLITPISNSADSIDCNPFASDDEIPLTKYFETSISSSKEKLSVDFFTEDKSEMLLTKYSISNQLSGQINENITVRKATRTQQTYYCPYCPIRYKFKHNILSHIQIVHPKDILTYSNTEFEQYKIGQGQQTTQSFQCPYCSTKFKLERSVRRHIKTMHRKKYLESSNISKTTEYRFLCPYCPAKLKIKRSIRRHVKDVHPNKHDEYSINPPPIMKVLVNLISTRLNDEFSKTNNHTEDSQSLEKLTSEEETIAFNYHNYSSEIITENEAPKVESIDVDHQDSTTTKQAYQCPYCPAQIKSKKDISIHIKKIHPKEFPKHQPKITQVDLELSSSISNNQFSEIIKEENETSVSADKNLRRNNNITNLTECNPLSSDDEDMPLTKHVNTSKFHTNSKEAALDIDQSPQSEFKCNICDKMFNSAGHLRDHTVVSHAEKTSDKLRQHRRKKYTEYRCQHCPQTFQDRDDFNDHFQHCHPTEFEIFSDYDGFIAKWEKELECYMCKNKFKNFSLLKKHFEVEHPKDKCYVLCCGLKLSYRMALVDHIRFHLDPDYFTCKVCGKRTISSRNLKRHMRYHVQDPELQCKVCKKYFTHKSKLTLHSGIHITEKNFKCKVCDKGFSTELLQKKHEFNYHQESICDQCGKSFSNSTTLKQHQQVHDEARVNLSCEICDRQFESKHTLYCHKKAFHVDDSKAYVCSVCGKMYASEINLNSHKQAVHTTKRFRCTVCDKEFKSRQSFYQHKASHNLSSRVRCPHCTSEFTQKGNFYRHLRIYHPEHAKMNRQKKVIADFSSVKQTIVI